MVRRRVRRVTREDLVKLTGMVNTRSEKIAKAIRKKYKNKRDVVVVKRRRVKERRTGNRLTLTRPVLTVDLLG